MHLISLLDWRDWTDTPWVLWPAWGWGIALALHTGYLTWGHLGGHVAAFAMTNAGLFTIDASLTETTWFYWPLVAWAITLAAHAYLYFAYAPVEAEPLVEYHDPPTTAQLSEEPR